MIDSDNDPLLKHSSPAAAWGGGVGLGQLGYKGLGLLIQVYRGTARDGLGLAQAQSARGPAVPAPARRLAGPEPGLGSSVLVPGPWLRVGGGAPWAGVTPESGPARRGTGPGGQRGWAWQARRLLKRHWKATSEP
jgi:hypothetical protein